MPHRLQKHFFFFKPAAEFCGFHWFPGRSNDSCAGLGRRLHSKLPPGVFSGVATLQQAKGLRSAALSEVSARWSTRVLLTLQSFRSCQPSIAAINGNLPSTVGDENQPLPPSASFNNFNFKTAGGKLSMFLPVNKTLICVSPDDRANGLIGFLEGRGC